MAAKTECGKKVKSNQNKPCKLVSGHRGKCRSILPAESTLNASNATASMDVASIDLSAQATKPTSLPVNELTNAVLKGAFKSDCAEGVVRRKHENGTTWSVVGIGYDRAPYVDITYRLDIEDSRHAVDDPYISETSLQKFLWQTDKETPIHFDNYMATSCRNNYAALDTADQKLILHETAFKTVGEAEQALRPMLKLTDSSYLQPLQRSIRFEPDGTMVATDLKTLIARQGGPQVTPAEGSDMDALIVPSAAIGQFFKAYRKRHGKSKVALSEPIEIGTWQTNDTGQQMILMRAGDVSLHVSQDYLGEISPWREIGNFDWDDKAKDIPTLGCFDVKQLRNLAAEAIANDEWTVDIHFDGNGAAVESRVGASTKLSATGRTAGVVNADGRVNRSEPFTVRYNTESLRTQLDSLKNEDTARIVIPGNDKIKDGRFEHILMMVGESQSEQSLKDIDCIQLHKAV